MQRRRARSRSWRIVQTANAPLGASFVGAVLKPKSPIGERVRSRWGRTTRPRLTIRNA